MISTRKLKDLKNVVPAHSFIIHPATADILKKQHDTDFKKITQKKNDTNLLLYSTINLEPDYLLDLYNIKYIDDLESFISYNKEKDNIRFVKIYFEHNKDKIKKINISSITNIVDIIKNNYKIDNKKIQINLDKIISGKGKWDELF